MQPPREALVMSMPLPNGNGHGNGQSEAKNGAAKSRRKTAKTGALEPVYPATGSIFDLVNDAIIAKSLDGTITQWNAAAEKMFGYSAKEIIGRSTKMLYPSDRVKGEAEILARAN